MLKKIKVLIVDDSMLIRAMFSEMLSQHADIEVVGTAVDPLDAREKIKMLNPDVITLDVEMPKMDGITFLEKIMRLRPMPVIMASSLTERGADITIQALEIGAVDFITKPATQDEASLLTLGILLAEKIRAASRSRLHYAPQHSEAKPVTQQLSWDGNAKNRIIAIGSSTGGVEALGEVLRTLPATLPPIVITQHMPGGFTASFAARLNKLCAPQIQEAQHHQTLHTGNVYIAPGDYHMEIESVGKAWRAVVRDGENVSGHKPSVDVLFASVAKQAGNKAVGIILTGMGRDGAQGLLEMRQAGAATIGQNEESCVVYGMPKVANQLGAVESEVGLAQIARAIITALGR